MAVKDGLDKYGVTPIQMASAKELDSEFTVMLAVFRDKETEFNWEARERSITRLRGILHGNSVEKYGDNLMLGIRHVVDGIIKTVESLRTTLALNALSLVEDIINYVGKMIDDYTFEQILQCMVRCASVTKKLVSSQSMTVSVTFLRNTNYNPKAPRILCMAMNEKNNQTRLHSVVCTNTLLRTHAHCERTRILMARKDGIKHIADIINKGLTDATVAVREACREPFWIFWEHWRDQAESILKNTSPAIRKLVEKSRPGNMPADSPKRALLRRAKSSLGMRRIVRDVNTVSPSNSTTSNGSAGSADMKSTSLSPRSLSPLVRSASPHLSRSVISPPPIPSPFYAARSPSAASKPLSLSLASAKSPITPTTPSIPQTPMTPVLGTPLGLNRHRSCVPLTRKKSGIFKAKLALPAMLANDDLVVRLDGLRTLARKLMPYPHELYPDLSRIQVEVNGSTTDGLKIKSLVWNMFVEDNVRQYEMLSSWEGVAGIMLKIMPFDEYIPRLILDASAEPRGRVQDEVDKHRYANEGLNRVKYVLERRYSDLGDQLYYGLLKWGGFGGDMKQVKRELRSPANRRSLTMHLLVWANELVLPLIQEPSDEAENEALDWLGDATTRVASAWFQLDEHIRLYLHMLVTMLNTSASGSIWHDPLKKLVAHLRQLNPALFDTVMYTFDGPTVNRVSRLLGVHIRLIPEPVSPKVEATPVTDDTKEETEEMAQDIEQEIAQEMTQEMTQDMAQEEVQEDPQIITPQAASLDQVSLPDLPSVNTVQAETQPSEIPQAEHSPLEPQTLAAAMTTIHATELPIQSEPRSRSPNLTPLTTGGNSAVIETANPMVKSVTEPVMTSLPTPTTGDDPVKKASDEPVMNGAIMDSPVSETAAPTFTPPPAGEREAFPLSDTLSPPPETVSTLSKDRQDGDEATLLSSGDLDGRDPFLHADILLDEPLSIPYFAPTTVTDALEIFEKNERVSPSGEKTKDRVQTLYGLVDKLTQPDVDISAFHKLLRLSKESSVLKKWDQGGCDEPGSEVWAGANRDGGNFVETVQALFPFLTLDSALAECALELLQQLATTQTGLFRFYERKVDAKGMSLEARLIERLLMMRDSKQTTMGALSESAMDALLTALDPQTVFEILLAYLAFCLTQPDDTTTTNRAFRYHPVGSAFTYLGRWIKDINDTHFLDEWLMNGGTRVFYRGINDDRVQVRKACVDAIVEFQEVLGDKMYTVLHLRDDQLNLVRHYVIKSTKKKASVRNLSATGQLR